MKRTSPSFARGERTRRFETHALRTCVRRNVVMLAGVILLSGCYSRTQLDAKLRPHAATDLECPEGKLNVYETGAATREVSGCGRKRSYIGVCAHFECGWIENDGETVAQFFKANTQPVPTFTSNAPTRAPVWRSTSAAPPKR